MGNICCGCEGNQIRMYWALPEESWKSSEETEEG